MTPMNEDEISSAYDESPGVVVADTCGGRFFIPGKRWETVDGELHIFDRNAVLIATYATGTWMAVCDGAFTGEPPIQIEMHEWHAVVRYGVRPLAILGCMPDGIRQYASVAEWEAANE